jgi:hypothetical protein
MPTQLETWNVSKLEPASFPEDARIDAARLGVSLTLARGTVLGKKTADSKLYAYDTEAIDGTETPVAILVYDTVTDAAGKHYVGTSAVASSLNLPHNDAQVYVAGVFNEADLTGWDAGAAAALFARQLPSGAWRIP